MGATIGVAQAYIADVTAPERRAHAMGMLGAAFAMGFILGPALGGILKLGGALQVPRAALSAVDRAYLEKYERWATPFTADPD